MKLSTALTSTYEKGWYYSFHLLPMFSYFQECDQLDDGKYFRSIHFAWLIFSIQLSF